MIKNNNRNIINGYTYNTEIDYKNALLNSQFLNEKFIFYYNQFYYFNDAFKLFILHMYYINFQSLYIL